MFLHTHLFVFTALSGGIDNMETLPMVEDLGLLDKLLKPADQKTPEDCYGFLTSSNHMRPGPIISSPVGLGFSKNSRGGRVSNLVDNIHTTKATMRDTILFPWAGLEKKHIMYKFMLKNIIYA